jgi:phosphohistidine swiveling domain-containing protein
MVKALIELDEDTNKTLNIVKAKYELKDKGHAIEFVVKKYNEGLGGDEVIGDLKYFKDGDKWMFAEEIPDMDFYFSQIWLTCFINEFNEPGGRAFNKMLAIYEDYHLWFYYGENDSKDVGDHLVNRFLNEDSFVEEVNKNIVKTSDDLREFSEKLPERNIDLMSNESLWKIYEEHDRLHTIYYQWGWIPVAADMFHNNFTEKLKGYLREINVSEDKINEYLVILTQPTKKSLIQIEKEELLELALEIKKDNFHKNLFIELYRKFKEQDATKHGYKTHTKEYEEQLERKVSCLIIDIKPKILRKIKNYYEKYFYVNHMWVGNVLNFEYYLKELVKLIGNHSDVEKSLSEEVKEFEESLKQRANLIKKLEINDKWKNIFKGFGDFMVTKIYRRYAQIYALYKMEFILKEIASRYNLSLKQVRFMLPKEVKDMLFNDKVNLEELNERSKFCVEYAEKGKEIVFTGVKAKELAEEVRKVEISDVKELKGQVGCVGKARGIVKQIFRPADMDKMNKGDILVSIATDPDIVSAMKKAGAIVTEQGGVTSHAAIVSRELKIPCVIGTKIATSVLKDGMEVEVDANKGIVRILDKK